MTQDHVRLWVPDVGVPFAFDGDYLVKADLPEETLRRRLATGDTPGGDGEYSEADAPREVRVFSLKGRFNCGNLTDLQARFDTLAGGVRQNKPGQLVRRVIDLDTNTPLTSRYLRCRPTDITRSGERGIPVADWEIGFRSLSDKVLWYEEAVQTITLLVPAGAGTANTPVTAGGVEDVLPRVTLQVQTVGTGGDITVTHSAAAQFAKFAPDTAGAWVLDFDALTPGQALTFGGTSQMGKFAGGFPPIPASAVTVTLVVTGQVVVSGAALTYQRRFPFS